MLELHGPHAHPHPLLILSCARLLQAAGAGAAKNKTAAALEEALARSAGLERNLHELQVKCELLGDRNVALHRQLDAAAAAAHPASHGPSTTAGTQVILETLIYC